MIFLQIHLKHKLFEGWTKLGGHCKLYIYQIQPKHKLFEGWSKLGGDFKLEKRERCKQGGFQSKTGPEGNKLKEEKIKQYT